MSTEQEKIFQELQNKHQKISENAIRINTQIENAQEMRDKLKEAAQKKFGESNLEKLKEMAKKWTEENQKNLNDYEEKITLVAQEVELKNAMIKKIQQAD